MIIILPALSPTDDYSLGDGATRRRLDDETSSSRLHAIKSIDCWKLRDALFGDPRHCLHRT